MRMAGGCDGEQKGAAPVPGGGPFGGMPGPFPPQFPMMPFGDGCGGGGFGGYRGMMPPGAMGAMGGAMMGGAMMCGGGIPGDKGGYKGSSGEMGDFKGKGGGGFKGKGGSFKGGFGFKGSKGGGKGGFGGGPGGFKGSGDAAGGDLAADDPRRQILIAQRQAKHRGFQSEIMDAQRAAKQRFEAGLLERVQGTWVDESDPNTSYVVNGNICEVAADGTSRVFRNRLGVYAGDLCWDARRFWHKLELKTLPPEGETLERVEWTQGEGSPPTRPIVWLRGTPNNGEKAEGTAVPESGVPGGEQDDDSEAEETSPAIDAQAPAAVPVPVTA